MDFAVFLAFVGGSFTILRRRLLRATFENRRIGLLSFAVGQPQWADYSGVSRTMHSPSEAEVVQLHGALEAVEALLLEKKVVLAAAGGRVELDADLTPRAVFNTSETYPFGLSGRDRVADESDVRYWVFQPVLPLLKICFFHRTERILLYLHKCFAKIKGSSPNKISGRYDIR
jgi:hypothetical protein